MCKQFVSFKNCRQAHYSSVGRALWALMCECGVMGGIGCGARRNSLTPADLRSAYPSPQRETGPASSLAEVQPLSSGASACYHRDALEKGWWSQLSKGPDTKILAALEGLRWRIAAEEDATAGFDGKGHDDIVDRLRRTIENTLGSSVRVSVLQSLEDAGCDILIETAQAGPKYGIQLKSHFDISEKGFGGKVSAQVQDSRQHDLQRLFVVLAGDLTSRSQIQKVRGLESRFSKMNDKYAMVVPPEQAWTLLCAPKRAPAPLTPHFAHAYPLQPNFTGRVKARKRLTEWLTQDEQPVLALVAFGGVGKSAPSWASPMRGGMVLPRTGPVADSS